MLKRLMALIQTTELDQASLSETVSESQMISADCCCWEPPGGPGGCW